MPSTHTDLIDFIFELAETAGKPLSFCTAYTHVGQAGTLKAVPRDSPDLDLFALTASRVVLADADARWDNVDTGVLTQTGAAVRLRVIAYVASTLGPAVTTDYNGRYTLTPDDDGYLPELCDLELGLSLARVGLRAYFTDHDNGQWIDPNALAGAVADVHDAALALET